MAVWPRVNAIQPDLTQSLQVTDLGRNIAALRKKLGSVQRELSYAGLAKLLSDRLGRVPAIAPTTVRKWELSTVGHPDPWALIEMAKLAEMSVEAFAGEAPPIEAIPVPGPEIVVPTEEDLAARALEALRQSREGKPVAKKRPTPKRGKGR